MKTVSALIADLQLLQISGIVHSHLAEVGNGIGVARRPSASQATVASMQVTNDEQVYNPIKVRGHLCRAQGDLDNLLSSVSHFCIWWKNIAYQLKGIETIMCEMVANESGIFPGTRILEIQKGWLDVHRRCDLYVQRVGRIAVAERLLELTLGVYRSNRSNKSMPT